MSAARELAAAHPGARLGEIGDIHEMGRRARRLGTSKISSSTTLATFRSH